MEQIKQLLEKYYEGNTSLEEDQLLKDYFRNQQVPSELEADKELFLYTSSESRKHLMNTQLKQKLVNWIDQQEPIENKRRMVIWQYRLAGVAAMLAIVVTCYLSIFQSKTKTALVTTAAKSDTIKDTKMAYAEAKRALLFVSQQLNKGTAPLGQMDKLSIGMNRLSSVSSFHDGLESLQIVSKYYKTSNSENNKKK